MPNLAALKAQLRIADVAIKELTKKSTRLDQRRKELRAQIRQAELKKLGLVPGANYRMIPKERAGDILEGTFKKFSHSQWNDRMLAVFRCPQTGRFKEQMRHMPVEEWEFERVNPKKEVKQ